MNNKNSKLEYQKLLQLRRDQENLLYNLIKVTGKSPREIKNEIDMNHKRLWYILEKWCRQRKYEYGVNLELGWLIDEEASRSRTTAKLQFEIPAIFTSQEINIIKGNIRQYINKLISGEL